MSVLAQSSTGHVRSSSAGDAQDIAYPSALPFVLVHVSAFAAFWTGVPASAVMLCIVLYVVRMFGVTAGYHRYFSHRAFTTGRTFQFVLALLAQSSAQKSVLWWAATHRHHHRHSDTAQDVHSPRHAGFFYSHVGWMFIRRHDKADLSVVPDLARYPELRLLHRYPHLPAIGLAGISFAVGGWPGLIVGFVWSTVLVYHATFFISSIAHVHGSRRYVTGDDSRNSFALAVLTMGEGWHNNHHAFQSSARQGFRWWEVDLTYYILKLLAWLRLVSALKVPPRSVIRNEQRLGAKVVTRASTLLANQFCVASIVASLKTETPPVDLEDMKGRLSGAIETGDQTANWLSRRLPTRDAVRIQGRKLFPPTPSFEDIVNRAHETLLSNVRGQLLIDGVR